MKKILLSVFMLSFIVPALVFASFNKNLSSGAKGDSVRELQTFLTAQGLYSGGITGTYSNSTKKAVSDLQNKYGIKPASGLFGSLTRAQANKLTVTKITTSTIPGCTSAVGYSLTTGVSCSGQTPTVIIKNTPISNVVGCTSTIGQSSTTGLSCSGDRSCINGSFFNKNTGVCTNYLAYCQNQNGLNATYDSVKNSCGCATGYTLNSSNVCVVPQNGYQICSEAFPNGTWDGTYGSTGKYNCVCQTGYVWNSVGTSCQVQPIDNSAQRYQTQYQTIQVKIKPLQDQASSLQAICPNLTQALGEEGIKCTLAASQAADVYGYINAIMKDFLTPVTDTSIIYENKLDDLQQQIFKIKMDYEQQVANINGSGISLTSANGQIQNATTAANTKINALNQQIQTNLTAYQNGIILY